jgi:hypothetical protein
MFLGIVAQRRAIFSKGKAYPRERETLEFCFLRIVWFPASSSIYSVGSPSLNGNLLDYFAAYYCALIPIRYLNRELWFVVEVLKNV